jgi:hypothetical protein
MTRILSHAKPPRKAFSVNSVLSVLVLEKIDAGFRLIPLRFLGIWSFGLQSAAALSPDRPG